jgi:hypothetical protein
MRIALDFRRPVTPNARCKSDRRRCHLSAKTRPRHGRILAECIVSLGVLAVGVTVSLTLSRASLVLADDARLMNEVAATAGAHAERATADACSSAVAAGQFSVPRIQFGWTDADLPSAAQLTRQRHVIATVQFSPLANRDSSSFAIDAAGVCPW